MFLLKEEVEEERFIGATEAGLTSLVIWATEAGLLERFIDASGSLGHPCSLAFHPWATFEKYWPLQTRASLQSNRFRSHLSATETSTDRNMPGLFHIINSLLGTNCALSVHQFLCPGNHEVITLLWWGTAGTTVWSLSRDYHAHVAQERTLMEGEDKWRLSGGLGVSATSWRPSAALDFEGGKNDFHHSVIHLKT